MGLGTFVPGVFAGTYNGTTLGLTTSDGWRLKWRDSVKKINDTNAYGDTLIDGIYRGKSGVQLMVTVKEWNSIVKAAIWPYSVPATPVFDGKLGQIGQLTSNVAKAIVLTPEASSPAAGVAETILTASKAILSPDNDLEFLMGPVERDIPLLFDLLLYDDSGVKRFFALSGS